MPFRLTEKILDAWYPPERFEVIIVYGPLGIGKSTYQFKVTWEVLKQVYHLSDEEAWEAVKQYIVFHPSQFFQKIEEIKRRLGRAPVLNWDDAGLWLFALEYKDPFVMAFSKWLNVARTHLAALICSTPSPTWILKKLREFPSAITVRVGMVNGDRDHSHQMAWRRQAVGYRYWEAPDFKKHGVRRLFMDSFSCRMSDSFFEWYKPLRDHYEGLARRLMEEEWKRMASQSPISKLLEPGFELPQIEKLAHKWLRE
ncbi:MAG: hypothetical protein ACXQTQ_05590 [Candidatus Hecatellaceae archaeon]